MSVKILGASLPSYINWGIVGLASIGTAALAMKVYSIFNRSEKLLAATHCYLEFINRISKGENFPHSELAKSLLAHDCQKVLNGNLFTKNRHDFVADLLEVQKTKGSWTVKPVDIIASPQSKSVTLRLMINMEKLGAFTAIVILRFDSKYLISEINEVFSKMEGSYNFEGSAK